MPPSKIDLVELNRLLKEGKSQRECAEHFSVSKGAVSMARKKLKNTIIRATGLERANEVIESDLNLMNRLRFIMEGILDELESVKKELREGDGSKSQLRDSLVALTAESRKQLNLLKEIGESWYDHKASAEFQREVLEVIGSVDQETKKRIIERLKQKRIVRQAISFH